MHSQVIQPGDNCYAANNAKLNFADAVLTVFVSPSLHLYSNSTVQTVSSGN